MADGRHVGKYSKCHNSPTNGPTETQLGWSHPKMFSTCPLCCGCHGQGWPLTFLLLIDDLQVDCLAHKYVDDTAGPERILQHARFLSAGLILMTWLSISLKRKRWLWAQWHCPPTYPSYNGQRVKSNE